VAGAPRAVRTYRAEWTFDPGPAAEEIRRRYGVLTLDGFGFGAGDEALVSACGGVVAYLAETQGAACAALRPPRVVRDAEVMELDEMTRRNLELVEPLSGAEGATVLSVLDETLTP